MKKQVIAEALMRNEIEMTEYSIEERIFRKPYISGEKIITWKFNQIIDEHNTFEDIESDFRNQIKSGHLHNLHNLRGKWVLAHLHFYNKNESLKKTIRVCEYYEKNQNLNGYMNWKTLLKC